MARPYRQVLRLRHRMLGLLRQRDPERARELLDEALRITQEIEVPCGRAQSLANLLPIALRTSQGHSRAILRMVHELYRRDWRHWRTSRAFRDALRHAKGLEPELVQQLAVGASLKEERRLRRALGLPCPPVPETILPLVIDDEGIGPMRFGMLRGQLLNRIGRPDQHSRDGLDDHSCVRRWTYLDWFLRADFYQAAGDRLGAIDCTLWESRIQGHALLGEPMETVERLAEEGVLPGLELRLTLEDLACRVYTCRPFGLVLDLQLRKGRIRWIRLHGPGDPGNDPRARWS